MSLHISLLLVEGDHLARIDEIFELFAYRVIGTRAEVVSFDEVSPFLLDWNLGGNRVLKATCFSQGWTVIFDPELVLLLNDEPCAKLAAQLQTRVVGLLCEGTSGSYGFNLFSPSRERGLLSVNGEVVEDVGTPLPVESQFDKKRLSEGDVMAVMNSFGVDYDRLLKADRYIVTELDGSLGGDESAGAQSRSEKRPWWKFW